MLFRSAEEEARAKEKERLKAEKEAAAAEEEQKREEARQAWREQALLRGEADAAAAEAAKADAAKAEAAKAEEKERLKAAERAAVTTGTTAAAMAAKAAEAKAAEAAKAAAENIPECSDFDYDNYSDLLYWYRPKKNGRPKKKRSCEWATKKKWSIRKNKIGNLYDVNDQLICTDIKANDYC